MPTRKELMEGALVGLPGGAALGVPSEFGRPVDLPPAELIEFEPPPGFRRAHSGTPCGTWSDDSAQALCLLDSLLTCGRFGAEDFARRLLRWDDDGYLAVDNRVFDIGITTARGLSALRLGVPPLQAGPTGESANGNRSLLRVLPPAPWHPGPHARPILRGPAPSR